MKRIFFLLMAGTLCATAVLAQQYPITGITISLPSNPPANTANWGTGASTVVITAQTNFTQGQVNGHVAESKVLVTIEKAGSKICGSYTSSTAPMSGFSSAVKTYTGSSAMALLAQDCTLPPGNYELCVQFFGEGPVGYGPFSEKKCKSFTIQDTKPQNYNPPVNMTPVDKKVFTANEIKAPVIFRWLGVMPKPRESVTYRLRVWQLMEGQTGTMAMKTNQPLIEKDVKDQTQTVISNLIDGPCKPPYMCDFIWNVQALDIEGKPIGSKSGFSEPTGFGYGQPTSMMTAQCNFTPRLDSIYCTGACGNGKIGYRVRIKLDNTAGGSTLMNFANATNYSLHTAITAYTNVNTSNNLIQAWNLTPPAYGSANVGITTTSVSPFYPNTIAAGTAPTTEVVICVPANSSLPIRLRVFISMISTNGVPGICDDDVLINALPPCPCTYCIDDMIQLTGQNTITDANNVLTLNNTISIPGIQVKQFKAELIGFTYRPQNGNDQCWVCNKDDNQWGNFVGGTFTNPFPSMVNGVFPSIPCCGGNSHHTIGWWGNATVITNKPLQLKISLPPASTLSCCPYTVDFCIRYTFTDSECRSCSLVKCFRYTRNPEVGGPVIIADDHNNNPQ